jgi:hypothetical protein
VRKSIAVVAVLATSICAGAAAPIASAGKTTAPAPAPTPTPCSFSYEQPFYAWDDLEWYGLAPGSNFTSSKTPTGWSLANKAAVVAGGNPYRPWSRDYSLYIPPNGSATTPAFCVDQYSPYSRMFAWTSTMDASVTGGLRVDVIYTNTSSKSVTTTVATLDQQSSWNPTEQFPLIAGSVAPKWDTKGQAMVKYKFTAINGTAWRIDDVFIDPKRH